jgi:HEAT repeat protein
MEESALLVKLAAIDALGNLKDERAAEPLAKLVTEPGPRVQAVKALQSLGSKAEAAEIALLAHAEPEVRLEACRLLKNAGTDASLAALQTAAQDDNKSVAQAAKDAMAAIANRK